jgi:uncharacterized protein YjbI with pentapeptide repeats
LGKAEAMAMEIHDKRDVLDVRDATVANSRFDNTNLSNTQFHNTNLSNTAFVDVLLCNSRIVDANMSNAFFSDIDLTNVKIEKANIAGMTINGIAVDQLLKDYEAAQAAGGK